MLQYVQKKCCRCVLVIVWQCLGIVFFVCLSTFHPFCFSTTKMPPHVKFKTGWSFHRFHQLCSTPAAFAPLALVLDQYKQAEYKGCWARMSRRLCRHKIDDIVTSQLSTYSANVGRRAGLLIQTWDISYCVKLIQCRAETFSSAGPGLTPLCPCVPGRRGDTSVDSFLSRGQL